MPKYYIYIHTYIYITSHCLRQWFPTGASIHPEAMMHFPPVSDFPLFLTNLLIFWKMSKILPLPEKISHFHPPKFLTTFFLVIDSQKFIISPYFSKFPPCFPKVQQLFTYFTCIFPRTLTMLHLCITQCTYWTPLVPKL